MLQFTSRHTSVRHHKIGGVQTALTCQQAFQGALVAGREKEQELISAPKKSMRNADWWT